VLLVKFQYFYSYFIKRKMAEETGLLALLEEMLVRIAKYLGKRTN
jgi:CRISPR/Cas system CSM-associated protein Csm2 small subunit